MPSRAQMIEPFPRPFLKWAGGKRQLLPLLLPCLSSVRFGHYHEPFLGGGALFFELARLRRLRKKARLSDSNTNLIEAYLGVRDHLADVILLLREHEAAHCEAHYYAVRQQVPETLAARAARLIYLNKTCFNGLYRENSRGQFNVPMGRYVNPLICDEPNLASVSQTLSKARLEAREFETVTVESNPGDLVYFDPPYHPVSKTSSFTAYAKSGFGPDDQNRLASTAKQLHDKGVFVLISNSYTEFVLDTFGGPGFTIDEVHATRALNSCADRRGKISEALIRNF